MNIIREVEAGTIGKMSNKNYQILNLQLSGRKTRDKFFK